MSPNLRDLNIEKCQGHTLADKTSQEHSQEEAIYKPRKGALGETNLSMLTAQNSGFYCKKVTFCC